MELQGTPPSDLTGKMTKWAVGAAGGPVIGVERSGLSRSGAERGWTFPATACVTSIRTTAVLPYCPTRRHSILDPRPLPLHCRSFAFAPVATRSPKQPAHFAPPSSIPPLYSALPAIAAHVRFRSPTATTLPRRPHHSLLPIPLDAPSLLPQHNIGTPTTPKK